MSYLAQFLSKFLEIWYEAALHDALQTVIGVFSIWTNTQGDMEFSL